MRDLFSVLFYLLAAALGTISLLAALLAQQVADPQRPGQALAAALEEPAARAVVADEVTDRVLAERPELRRAEVKPLTSQVLAQPAVRDVLRSVATDESGNLDSAALTDEIASELRARGQDRLAAEVREQSGLLPPVGFSGLVEAVQRARIAAWTVSAVAGVGAALLAFFGFASGSTAARRWAGLGLAVAAVGVLARLVLGSAPDVVGRDTHPVVVLAAGMGQVAAPSAFWPVVGCLLVGVVCLLVAVVVARRP